RHADGRVPTPKVKREHDPGRDREREPWTIQPAELSPRAGDEERDEDENQRESKPPDRDRQRVRVREPHEGSGERDADERQEEDERNWRASDVGRAASGMGMGTGRRGHARESVDRVSGLVNAFSQTIHYLLAMSRRLLNRDRLVELLESASRCRVAVLGDAMLDVYLRGDVERISPEAPVPVVRVRERRHALGGAGNVGQNVRAVGAMCDLVAAIGDDIAGRHLCGMLEAIGAPVTSLVTVDRPTTTKTRIVARSQQVVRVDEE